MKYSTVSAFGTVILAVAHESAKFIVTGNVSDFKPTETTYV